MYYGPLQVVVAARRKEKRLLLRLRNTAGCMLPAVSQMRVGRVLGYSSLAIRLYFNARGAQPPRHICFSGLHTKPNGTASQAHMVLRCRTVYGRSARARIPCTWEILRFKRKGNFFGCTACGIQKVYVWDELANKAVGRRSWRCRRRQARFRGYKDSLSYLRLQRKV